MNLSFEKSSTQESVSQALKAQTLVWHPWLVGVSWLLRLCALASLLLLGWFVIAHVVEGGPRPTGQEWLGLVLFPGGVMLGLLMSLRYPTVGGGIAASGLGLFYIWNWSHSGRLPDGPFFVLFAAPALALFAVDYLQRKYRGVAKT